LNEDRKGAIVWEQMILQHRELIRHDATYIFFFFFFLYTLFIKQNNNFQMDLIWN
jgi:hypothetical protein